MELIAGILLVIVGGLLEGTFSMGIRRAVTWRWEHTWGLGSVLALVLVPWPVAYLTIPHLLDVLHEAPASAIVAAVLFGLGWGIGGIFYGLAVNAIGVAFGVSLIMGLCTVFGSAGPPLIREPGIFLRPAGWVLILGLVVMIIGIVICSLAGRKKEEGQTASADSAAARSVGAAPKVFITGLLLCLLSGFLSPLVNYAFIFGEPIKQAAVTAGAKSASAPNAIWAIVFTVNFIINILYCVYLLIRNRSAAQFFKNSSPTNWFWALYLGLTWPLGIVLYGIGAAMMGPAGGYAGFPMWLTCALLGSNIAGAAIGEWRQANQASKFLMKVGVVVLILATILFGYSNSLMGKS